MRDKHRYTSYLKKSIDISADEVKATENKFAYAHRSKLISFGARAATNQVLLAKRNRKNNQQRK